jgi:hypothetical protein
MSVHRIQLRGPWQLEWTSAPGESVQKVRLPAEWDDLFAGHSGPVRLTRKFHRPTNLGPNEQVELVFQQWPGIWTISLNQHPVGKFRDSSAERAERITITALLQSTNELAAETLIEQPRDANNRLGLVGQITIEIRNDEEQSRQS